MCACAGADPASMTAVNTPEQARPTPSPAVLRLVAPPPFIYMAALLIGIAIDARHPVALFLAWPARGIAGAILLILGGGFARWAFVTMRQSGTTASPKRASATLVDAGPFRLSRNPIYVAMTALYVGIALLLGSMWPLLLLAPLMMTMHWGVILREERYLAGRFGDAYTAYRARVRRWL